MDLSPNWRQSAATTRDLHCNTKNPLDLRDYTLDLPNLTQIFTSLLAMETPRKGGSAPSISPEIPCHNRKKGRKKLKKTYLGFHGQLWRGSSAVGKLTWRFPRLTTTPLPLFSTGMTKSEMGEEIRGFCSFTFCSCVHMHVKRLPWLVALLLFYFFVATVA